jgi:hypothetical protein
MTVRDLIKELRRDMIAGRVFVTPPAPENQ